MELFKNDYLTLSSESDKLYITVHKPGFEMQKFNGILLDYPTLAINNFLGLKKALESQTTVKELIGFTRSRVEVYLSSDEMQASIKLNITAREFTENKISISSEIIRALQSAGISEGLDDLFSKPITVQKDILIAKGVPPVDGEDAKTIYFKLSEKKPIIKEDGRVNHYDLNLIDRVKAGDWLGEKLPPTKGKPGKTVTGKPIPAKNGRDVRLIYDRKTIHEFEEGEKKVLRAAIDGAVKIDGGKIRVDNLLVVPGDVCFETGNINFDGYITIYGTVQDGFSVTAKHDISINGEMGIGAVDKIVSLEGSIFIKGGVFGKSVAHIDAKKNVFIKYCNECTIKAGDEINIGFYALDSDLAARKIILDPLHGKIIGGCVTAETQISAGTVGNKLEKKTVINVKGFDRNTIRKELEDLLLKYKHLLEESSKLRRQLDVFEYNIPDANYLDIPEYIEIYNSYENLMNELRFLEELRQKLQKVLETKGEGEISILKAAYPETYMEIKNMPKRIVSVVSGSFYAQDRELHHND